jgi:hypothetical protein
VWIFGVLNNVVMLKLHWYDDGIVFNHDGDLCEIGCLIQSSWCHLIFLIKEMFILKFLYTCTMSFEMDHGKLC